MHTESWRYQEWSDHCDHMQELNIPSYDDDYRNDENKKNEYIMMRYATLLETISKELNLNSVPYIDFWKKIIENYNKPLDEYMKEVLGE